VLELALLLLDGGICPVEARLFLSSGPLGLSTSFAENDKPIISIIKPE